MESLIGTFIENDEGELRDLYLEECKQQGFVFPFVGGKPVNLMKEPFIFVSSKRGIDGHIYRKCLSAYGACKEITLEDFEENSVSKPPLGLMPLNIYKQQCDQQRLRDIFSAMERYSKEKLPIPVEWVNELSLLLSEED